MSEHKFLDEYLTYDFETVTKPINERYGNSSFQESTLHGLSVAWIYRVRDESKKTMIERSKFLYRDQMDEHTFINQWLNDMFKDAELIYKSREAYYKSLNLPEYL
jgi:hypothetical protein